MGDALDVAILEPYYGGSHRWFVDTVQCHSRHRCKLATMPARKWKWRMRGASVWFTRSGVDWMFDKSGKPVDVILCNDMMSVSDLRSLLPNRLKELPIVCYFHENQLTYPILDEKDRDFQYGMTNILSCLAADAVWFNSDYHRHAFHTAADKLLRLMPDYVPEGMANEILKCSEVLPPPVSIERVEGQGGATKDANGFRGRRPRILWSHRWEYDKNPKPFFEALVRLHEEDVDFEIVCLGEQFRTAPPEFEAACIRLQPRLVHSAYVPDRDAYLELLSTCDIVVSTAIQENFGLSVLEAAIAGCQPIVPNRLAYPEVIPASYHLHCLYEKDSDLLSHLRAVLSGPKRLSSARRKSLSDELQSRYGVHPAVKRLDDGLIAVVRETLGINT